MGNKDILNEIFSIKLFILGWRNRVGSLGVVVSIIVVNTSLLNISYLIYEIFGFGIYFCSWVGKSEL